MDAEQLKSFFGRCYVISLARRPERLQAFREHLALRGWPFRKPQLLEAIDGKVVPSPPWWRCGGGAWGVYRSNLRIIEDCLMGNVESVLIIEDDAVLCDKFTQRVAEFLRNVPKDWQQLYIGGQHLFRGKHLPVQVSAEVLRPYNVNRCHAYALSRSGMEVAYKHLTANSWQPKHHIDHRYGALHQRRGIKVYTPTTWLAGQAAGHSDICGKDISERFWTKGDDSSLPIVLAVLGPYRGGTSAVAGALHHMGIVMGHKFFVGNRSGQAASPKGCFEAQRLFDICLACYPEPRFREGKSYQRRVELLRGWLRGRQGETGVIGAKHPKLCLMVPEILTAWPDCKFVVVHRPIEESAKSLAKLGWWQPAQNPEKLIRRMVETRDQDVVGMANDRVFHANFADFLANPQDSLARVAEFAGIKPSPEQYASAAAHLDPKLKHYGNSGE